MEWRMGITYSTTREFELEQLQRLFLSVGWSSGQYPQELCVAMRNSHHVVSAWDGETLVGLINALSDGAMTAYFHYLLVHPEYQGRGVGRELVRAMLEAYQHCARKVLVAYDREVGFYEKCGFVRGDGATPMFVTHLTT
jgi:ribosomal protein S18 acetylase RimI-like enzyme